MPRGAVTRCDLRMTTGTPGASYYPLGHGLAVAYQHALPDLHVIVDESPGSLRNVEAIQSGSDDIGFAFADTAYLAYVGRLTGQPFDALRAIALLQLSPVHLVVRRDAEIRDIADLRGRRIGVGPPGSGTASTAELLLREHGLTFRMVHAEPLSMNDAAARLGTGTLDAMFADAGDPADSVTLATRAGARLVPIEGPAVTRLRRNYPFFVPVAIPPDTYPGHSESIHTIGVQNVVVCRRDLDERLVYELTRELFAALPSLSSEQPSLNRIRMADVAATPIPLHAGAARYYRELELLR
jgi:TRAP transporter TAXI family solute receptor